MEIPLVCGMLSREAFTAKQRVNNDKDGGQLKAAGRMVEKPGSVAWFAPCSPGV
jgi:hypothetical protein